MCIQKFLIFIIVRRRVRWKKNLRNTFYILWVSIPELLWVKISTIWYAPLKIMAKYKPLLISKLCFIFIVTCVTRGKVTSIKHLIDLIYKFERYFSSMYVHTNFAYISKFMPWGMETLKHENFWDIECHRFSFDIYHHEWHLCPVSDIGLPHRRGVTNRSSSNRVFHHNFLFVNI